MTGTRFKTNPSSFGNQSIKKGYSLTKVAKPRNSDKTAKGLTMKSSIPRSTRSVHSKTISCGTEKKETASFKDSPIFQTVVPMHAKHRQVFENLSNSPNVIHDQKPKKVQQSLQKEDIKFEEDPNALASILNDEGITNELLQENALKEGRPSMVTNNTYLFSDGRPSLCRRVPIQRKQPHQVNRRETVSGPRRVLASTKKGLAPRLSMGHRNNNLQQPYDRHSLYSVVQGRYSNTGSNFREGRMSLQASKKCAAEQKQENNRENLKLPYKSPPAVRVKSRVERISASPALRVKQAARETPLPQRSSKKCSQRGVTWKDNNVLNSKVNLVTHLFQDTSPITTPMQDKPIKTPVSILKNRKHSKRNSLTPPMMKKNKENDNYCTEDVVHPLVINDAELNEKKSEVSSELKMAIAAQSSSKFKQEKLSPGFSAKKTVEMKPKILQETSPVWSKISKPEASAAPKEPCKLHEANPDVDRVLKLMNRHITKVKRRSVQSELSNIMTKIQSSLKHGGLHEKTIPEDEIALEKEEQIIDDTIRFTSEEKSERPAKRDNAPPSLHQENRPPYFPLTPGTIKDIRENGGEECRKDFDRIALETERINEELKNLQLEKERLHAFQEKVKKFRSQRVKKFNVPELMASEKPPVSSFHQNGSAQMQNETQVRNQLSTSWDKLLKFDMHSSPPSCSGDVISRSSDKKSVSPLKTPNCQVNFLHTTSPHISALNLEKAKKIDRKRESFGSNDIKTSASKLSSNQDFKHDNEVSWEHKLLDNHSTIDNLKQLPTLPTYNQLFSKEKEIEAAQQSAGLDFSFLKPLPVADPAPKVSDDSRDLCPKTSSLPFSCDITTLSSIKASPASSKAHSSPFSSSRTSTTNLQQLKSELEKPVFVDISSPTSSFGSDNKPLLSTPGLFAPNPIAPKPMKTPAAFRHLRMILQASPAKSQPAVKQQFAQALLDEEVSLLTCRVVKPDLLLSSQDPVAHSLSYGDDKHFVPIVKTPSATPRQNKRSSFGDSAFAKYLRM